MICTVLKLRAWRSPSSAYFLPRPLDVTDHIRRTVYRALFLMHVPACNDCDLSNGQTLQKSSRQKLRRFESGIRLVFVAFILDLR